MQQVYYSLAPGTTDLFLCLSLLNTRDRIHSPFLRRKGLESLGRPVIGTGGFTGDRLAIDRMVQVSVSVEPVGGAVPVESLVDSVAITVLLVPGTPSTGIHLLGFTD
jgi:hypothetical protein